MVVVVLGDTFGYVNFDTPGGAPMSEGQHTQLKRIEHDMGLFVLGLCLDDVGRVVCIKCKIDTNILRDVVDVRIE